LAARELGVAAATINDTSGRSRRSPSLARRPARGPGSPRYQSPGGLGARPARRRGRLGRL